MNIPPSAGIGGTYVIDPLTGERVPAESIPEPAAEESDDDTEQE